MTCLNFTFKGVAYPFWVAEGDAAEFMDAVSNFNAEIAAKLGESVNAEKKSDKKKSDKS